MAFSPSLSVITSVYKGEDYLAPFFENLREQTLFPELELVLVLNEPSAREKQLARDFQLHFPDEVEILHVQPRENLGTSWNRAWRSARAPYLAIWNVDDRRIVDSLQRQLTAMESHADWWLCYGDYLAVSDYGSTAGVRRYTPEYRRSHFRRAFAQGGAFWLFKRDLFEKVGYFDEQFRVGPDMDLSLRMAVCGLEMGRCDGLLGYFTDAGVGLSTREEARSSAIERTAIQLRYGVFDKVDGDLQVEARKYRLDGIQNADYWIPIEKYLPEIGTYLKKRNPLWLIGFFRGLFRRTMKRLGLLQTLHSAQEKYLKREI